MSCFCFGFPEVDHYGIWKDVDDVIAEREAEIADNEAGQEVCWILSAAIAGKKPFDEARNQILDLLCKY